MVGHRADVDVLVNALMEIDLLVAEAQRLAASLGPKAIDTNAQYAGIEVDRCFN